MRESELWFLEAAFLGSLLNLGLNLLLFLDGNDLLSALLIGGLLLTAFVANDTLALVVWHESLLLNGTTDPE
jgi:hypothetical protein